MDHHQHIDQGGSYTNQQCESCYDVAEMVPKQVISSILSMITIIVVILSTITIIVVILSYLINDNNHCCCCLVFMVVIIIIQVAEKVCHPVAKKVHFDNLALKIIAC